MILLAHIMSNLHQMTGRISIVQEGRFRLNSDDGRSALFVLAHDAPLDAQDLADLARSSLRLTVHFREGPGRAFSVAHDLTKPGEAARRYIGWFAFRR